MKTLTVGDFKAKFSQVLDDIKNGEEYTISYGKNKKEVAIILPIEKYKANQIKKLGSLSDKGTIIIKDDFKMTSEEFLGE